MQNSLLHVQYSTYSCYVLRLQARVGELEAPNAVPFGKYSEFVPFSRSHSRRLSFWLYGWPHGGDD